MKSFRPKPEMFDKRTLSEKMQEQEKKAQAREDKMESLAKRENELALQAEKEAAIPQRQPRTREALATGNDTDWKFHIEQRLSEIQGALINLTTIIVDRMPKPSAVTKATANAEPPLKTTNGGHPIVNGKPAPFIEVPSFETVMKAAQQFKAAHGIEALLMALKRFEVKQISELNDEQKAQFLESITDNA